MQIQFILAPLFVQVALTFALLFWMAFSRAGALKQRQTKLADIALGEPNWPGACQQISNCYNNQFQLPMLFYVLTILSIVTRHADFLFVIMAWLFVLTRIAHAYIHTGTNYVRHRFNAFAAGVFILLIMWVIFAVRILLGLP
ncbi:MAG TPA: MAPEG family protein [Pseudolabrys sp.]|jgi:hypothetical protein